VLFGEEVVFRMQKSTLGGRQVLANSLEISELESGGLRRREEVEVFWAGRNKVMDWFRGDGLVQ
jgi:hypothetical protein